MLDKINALSLRFLVQLLTKISIIIIYRRMNFTSPPLFIVTTNFVLYLYKTLVELFKFIKHTRFFPLNLIFLNQDFLVLVGIMNFCHEFFEIKLLFHFFLHQFEVFFVAIKAVIFANAEVELRVEFWERHEEIELEFLTGAPEVFVIEDFSCRLELQKDLECGVELLVRVNHEGPEYHQQVWHTSYQ